ncbi:sugar phosphate isomerase/epimerase family protein [Microbacterium azadirachtae]|uniref:Inosose dehydratase n=1 Tax=Microbacterium azadirachtae TaxID=582680 RepID=A0A0F0LEK4_9MICO|nr:sugar phosphate isomerase/epimerase family protein [Microbacterium azadirachtae]KJL30695.1 Inosose dehydratase [Microbacterium azadirachtae]
MILSTVTDEVTPDRSVGAFRKIFTMATEQGVRNFEIRMVEAKRFPVVEAAAWGRLKTIAAEYGIHYSAVSPGLFKADLHSDLIGFHSTEILSMSLDLAERIGVDTLITFGVDRSPLDDEGDFARVVDLLGEAADVAAARGFQLLLENIPGSWADTGENCLRLLEGIGRSNFGYVWDTGNLYEAEHRHFRGSYELLKPHIRNVHLKDGRVLDDRMVWQRFGTGETDIAGQIAALQADGYQGTLTVEAKCEPHEDDDFIESMTYLRGVMNGKEIAKRGRLGH